MSSYTPPTYVVSIYNPAYFATSTTAGVSLATATSLFLNKNTTDTATALETFNSGIATNSVATTTLASDLTVGSSTNTGTITIATTNTNNTNASPAISIGADAGTKTIKINNNANSVHCSSVDLKGSTINNITGTTGSLSIGDLQTTGTLDIGGLSTRTGAITIGNGGTTNILPITIGSTAATSTTTINNPIMSLSYTTAPTYTTANIGYTNTVILNSSAAFGDATVASAETTALSIASVPVGLWNISWGTVISSNSSSVPPAVISTYYMFINVSAQAQGVPSNYAGVGLQGQSVSVGPYTSSTIVNLSLSGSANVRITATATVALRYYLTTSSGTLRFWNAGGTPVKPSTYLTITRLA